MIDPLPPSGLARPAPAPVAWNHSSSPGYATGFAGIGGGPDLGAVRAQEKAYDIADVQRVLHQENPEAVECATPLQTHEHSPTQEQCRNVRVRPLTPSVGGWSTERP